MWKKWTIITTPGIDFVTINKHNPRYRCKHTIVTSPTNVTMTDFASRGPIVLVLLTNCQLQVQHDPWRAFNEAETSDWEVCVNSFVFFTIESTTIILFYIKV